MERNLIEILLRRAADTPDRIALRFLGDGQHVSETFTYARLSEEARAIAAHLQQVASAGDRALLLYPSGPHYVTAFFGCLYAGVIAVPAYPPESAQPQHLERLLSIIRDAEPRLILTESAALPAIEAATKLWSAASALQIVATDRVAGSQATVWRMPEIASDGIAFLQYTSGSTAAPKGVMVGHDNIIANEKAMQTAFSITADDVVLSWLPLFHDMGLIGALLQPIFSGAQTVLMAPQHFIERPIRWLRAIAEFRVTVSGGPNFAYRLCVDRINASALEGLDLGSWQVAFCGAEPIRAATLHAFKDKFSAYGFDERAFYPCYGLAEATLFVTGGGRGRGAQVSRFAPQALSEHVASADDAGEPLVGCGSSVKQHGIVVADAVSGQTFSDDGRVGEILVRGPSIAKGYWQNAAASEKTFEFRDGDRWLHTGDLGFLSRGELFVTGRLKDLIIARGRNLYPQDIENTVEAEIEIIRRGRVAAFPVEIDGVEGIGIAAEVSRGARKFLDSRAVFAAISEAVALAHQEAPSVILLLNSGALPRTSSGKLQRAACREGWRSRSLDSFARFERGQTQSPGADESPLVSKTELELIAIWKDVLGLAEISRDDTFFAAGGSSLVAVQMAARVQDMFGVPLVLSDFLHTPSIRALAERIDKARLEGLSTQILRITPVSRDGVLPLSHAQQRLWFLWKLQPASAAYNISGAVRLRGKLDDSALRRSFDRLIARHESLRTTFAEAEGRVHQVIHASRAVLIENVDLHHVADAARETEARRLAAAEALAPFDLESGPLVRVKLLRLADQDHVLLLTLHHIVSDGWSMNVLAEELARLYSAFSSGAEADLPPLPLQYADYASWHGEWLGSGELHRQLTYWKSRLGDEQPVLELPTDRPRPATQRFQGSSYALRFDDVLTEQLREFAKHHDVTLFMLLLGAFEVLLYRYTGQRDVRVGIPVANRQHPETERLIGFFVNTQVLRTELNGRMAFSELLLQIKSEALQAQANQDLPFERLVDELIFERDLARNPLVQVTYNHQWRNHELARDMGELRMEEFATEDLITQFDLTLNTEDVAGRLTAKWIYDVDLFDRAFIEGMALQWQSLLREILREPGASIGQFTLLGAEDYRSLAAWNDTGQSYAGERSLHEMVEDQVARTPHHTALVFESESLTYAELNGRANRVAHGLRRFGVNADDLVAVRLQRSNDLTIALLAILKAGAAYLPLDPSYPADRLEYVLAESRPRVVVTQEKFEALLAGSENESNLRNVTASQNLAYCIYTSGSTGRPKGVLVSHGAITNHMRWMCEALPVGEQDRVLQKTPAGFDASVWEFWLPLLTGGCLVMAPPGLERDPEALWAQVERHQITVLQAVPSLLQLLVRSPARARASRSLRHVLSGGEALSGPLAVELLAGSSSELWNLYGPTEATIDAIASRVRASGHVAVPIGRPIANTVVHILDDELNVVPIGARGELYIGGLGLARGYLNRVDLTAERFVPSPFSVKGERLYRTGDLVRYRRDGEIDYLGRADDQVKLRGHRIELAEIEARLHEQDAVSGAAVVVREERTGEQRLIGYVVGDPSRLDSLSQHGTSADAAFVAQWSEVFETTYEEPATCDGPTFVGWLSSYTQEPIPVEEMREWRSATIARIQALQPKSVLEIGCGAGLLIEQLAPGCEIYHATDLSSQAVKTLQRWLALQPALGHVVVEQRAATDFAGLATGVFDTVLLNSVVQYFPSAEYLVQVLQEAAKLLRPGGRIFIGDIRHLGTLELFHTSVQLANAPSSLSVGQLRGRVERAIAQEKELVLDPQFFHTLHAELPQLGSVQTSLRRGRSDNELTRYRYDVVLEMGHPEALQRPIPQSLLRVENLRLAADLAAVRALRDADARSSVAELRERLRLVNLQGDDPEHFWALAESENRPVLVSWTPESREGQFDVVWGATAGLQPEELPSASRRSAYANNPTLGKFKQQWGADLRERLRAVLPEYMVPTRIVVLERLPLTSSGKLDRRALPAPDFARSGGADEAPATVLEKQLAQIWTQVLAVDRVALNDNFFDLGGDSIMAIQVVSRARAAGIRIAPRDLFEYQTIGRLAAAAAEAAGSDVTDEAEEASNAVDHRTLEAGLGVTPSKFPLAGLTQAQLDSLLPDPLDVDDLYPLSPLQEGMLFHHVLDQASGAYVNQRCCFLRGRVDANALQGAWQAVVDTHDMLRAQFLWEGLEQPLQCIRRRVVLPLTEQDLRHLPPQQRQAALIERLEAGKARGFDIRSAPLLRVELITLEDDRYCLIWTDHHLLLDGWSLARVIEDVFLAYGDLISGRRVSIHSGLPYKKYIAMLRGADVEASAQFWTRAMQDVDTPTLLARSVPPVGSAPGHGTLKLVVASSLSQGLRQLAQAQRVTLSTVLQAAVALLLGLYTRSRDVIFGVTTSGRNTALPGIERAVGLFINTLPLRVHLGEGRALRDLLSFLQSHGTAMREHESVPLTAIQGLSRVARGAPLFDTLFVFENYPLDQALRVPVPGLRIEETQWSEQTHYALTIIAIPDDEIQIRLGYATEAFDAAWIGHFGSCLQQVLRAFVAHPDQKLDEVQWLEAPEFHRGVSRDYGEEWDVGQLIEAQVARTPDAIAVRFEDAQLTYAELNARANQLAHQLRAWGVGVDERVGVCAERSLELVIALLGVLKAGAAYVPLDPQYPAERLTWMLEDSQPRVVLTQAHLLERMNTNARTCCLDRDGSIFASQSTANPARRSHPRSLAYCLYTSGSTGRPKGAGNTHAGLMNRLRWMQEEYALQPSDRVLQKTPYSFDVSVWEFFWPLMTGARLVIAPPGAHQDPEHLARLIESEGITTIHFVPSMLQAFVQAEQLPRCKASLRQVICSGEALPASLQKRFFEHGSGIALHNLYGPTEAAIDVTYWACERTSTSDSVPIGHAIANTTMYVLDDSLRAVPIGVTGELYIEGAGLARGYHGRPDLTAERFIPNPYSEQSGERLYRTGDLGYCRADGAIEYVGRVDHQVKIRGLRIELGEIEARLREHADVQDTAVVVKDQQLVAYVVPATDRDRESLKDHLRDYLRAMLPEYMAPAHYVWLESLPLTSSGKLNRRALPDIDTQNQRSTFIAPRTDTEIRLAAIWSHVLRVERVGLRDHFFELGGHSLLAAQVISRVNAEWHVMLPLRRIFESATLEDLARQLSEETLTHLNEQKVSRLEALLSEAEAS